MNPLGLIIIGLGIICFIIGFKGTQHRVVNAFKGVSLNSGSVTTTPFPSTPGKVPGSSGTEFTT
jgi:hypothetical protein